LGEFLPETLESLANQTYPNIEVIVINDGSTQPFSLEVLEQMRKKYPQFRFITQVNGGIGAARNRGLAEAKGEFFVPVDADNIAHPRMIEVFVDAMRHRPDASSLASFHRAFRESEDIPVAKWRYFYRPTGGPHVLGPLQNVFGDANSIFRTEAVRSVGGFELDRDTSWEDYELFAKLVNAGHTHDVIPDYLFFYRHREESWMRSTNEWKNHRRVMRQFFRQIPMGKADHTHLWVLLVGLNRKNCLLEQQLQHEKHTAHLMRIHLDQARASKIYKLGHMLNRFMGPLPGAKKGAMKIGRLVLAGPRFLSRTFRRAKNAVGLKLPTPR
jgi:glycosyltransferase involved in cell wall biosynthesis